MVSSSQQQQWQQQESRNEWIGIAVSAVFGIALLIGGLYLKQSYKSKDVSRSKKENVTINNITSYDVTYRSGLKSDIVTNVSLSSIKSLKENHSFRIKDGKHYRSVSLPITSITKNAAMIEVTLEGARKAFIKKINFTKDILDNDVGKSIEIEYDSNDISNISMAVEGLTTSELWRCWSMIVIGVILIIVSIVLLIAKLTKKPSTS